MLLPWADRMTEWGEKEVRERSKEAVIAEDFLRTYGRKDLLADWDFMAELIQMCGQINEQPYEVPEIKMIGAEELSQYSHPLVTPMEKATVHGVESFLVNFKEDNANRVTVIYFHGGGYVFQAKYEHLALVNYLAGQTDCKVYFPVYPMAPNYSFVQAYEIMLDYYKGILEHTDPSSILFMGDSAGGGMALSLAKQLRDKGLPLPAGVILISPALDASMSNPEIDARNLAEIDPMLTHSFYLASEAWAAGEPLNHPYVSPMYGNLKGLPPMTLYVGTREMLWPDAQKFRELAAEQGVDLDYREWPGMNHCFCIYPIPEAIEAQKEIIGMINELDRKLE